MIYHETNMLRHNIQENDNNFNNMEFHTTFKNQIIIVWNTHETIVPPTENEYVGIPCDL